MTDPIQKDSQTVTDINSFQIPAIIDRLTPDQVSRLRRDPNIEYVAKEEFAYSAQQPGPTPEQQVTPWGYTKVKSMLAHSKEMIEYWEGSVAIHPRFDKTHNGITDCS